MLCIPRRDTEWCGTEDGRESDFLNMAGHPIHAFSFLRRRDTIVDDSIDSRIHLADAEVLGFRYNETVWLRILTV